MHRQLFCRTFYLPVGLIVMLGLTQCQSRSAAKEYYLIAGSYTHGDSEGIYVFSFNPEDGSLRQVSTMDGIKNPSYLTISGDYIYAVSETGGDVPGSLSAYRFNRENGRLALLNTQPTGGDDPCYVATDQSGKLVAVANYSGGSVAVFHTADDGKLMNHKQIIQHTGGSTNPDRQQGPHVHQSVFSPDEKWLLTPDLGKDRVMIYSVDKEAEQPLKLAGEIACEPGSGPRHLVYHPSLPYLYIIHELNPVVSVYQFKDNQFNLVQELPTWPDNFEGAKDGAEIKVSPGGQFLYISHRGDQNTIGIYQIDQSSGKLTRQGVQPVRGRGPRDFEIDPTGRFLLVANQQTNNIVTYTIDKETGLLTESANLEVPAPVCLKFTEK